MLGIRRKEARKAAKLARALASLDRQAALVRPAPRRVAKLSLGSSSHPPFVCCGTMPPTPILDAC